MDLELSLFEHYVNFFLSNTQKNCTWSKFDNCDLFNLHSLRMHLLKVKYYKNEKCGHLRPDKENLTKLG